MILNNSNHPFGELTPKPWIPLEHHKLGVKFLLEHAAAGLFLPPGFGKTADTLAAFKLLKSEGVARGMLVVAPRRVARSVWPRQILQWKDFRHLTFELIHGSGRSAVFRRPRADVYVTTYDGMRWVSQHWREMKELADTLVLDELSKYKHVNTQRFKTLRPLLPHFRRRWGLTGSPAAQSLMNLFGECYTLDLGRSLGAYVTHYRRAYFEPSGYGGFGWAPKRDAKRKIFERLKPLALHLDEKDFLKLPALEDNYIEVELDDEARRVYNELETELLTLLPDGRTQVMAPNVGAALMKCHQVANGALYHEKRGKRVWTAVHDAKLEALEDLVDELQGDPLMVAYQYQHDLERIQDRLDLDPKIRMGGGTPDRVAAELEDAWNAGALPVLPVHPTTVSHGLNLQEGPGHHLCWFANTYNYEEYDQLIRRLRRPGQRAAKVMNHHLFAKDTVDEAMRHSRGRKGRTQGQLLEALRHYKKRRVVK